VSGSGISWVKMQVCTSLQTDNHTSTPPLCFLQAGCPPCHPTNSVKALKASTNWQLLPINHCQLHDQPACTCYLSSINPLEPFGQLATTCWCCLHCHPSLAEMLSVLLHTICLGQVTAIHAISQQFQLIQISSRNPSVCSSLISTVLLPPSDRPRLRFKPRA